MAAHLDLAHLHQHALPADFMTDADRLIEASALSALRTDTTRPRLAATWRLDSDGRLVCHWSLDIDDPGLMPA